MKIKIKALPRTSATARFLSSLLGIEIWERYIAHAPQLEPGKRCPTMQHNVNGTQARFRERVSAIRDPWDVHTLNTNLNPYLFYIFIFQLQWGLGTSQGMPDNTDHSNELTFIPCLSNSRFFSYIS